MFRRLCRHMAAGPLPPLHGSLSPREMTRRGASRRKIARYENRQGRRRPANSIVFLPSRTPPPFDGAQRHPARRLRPRHRVVRFVWHARAWGISAPCVHPRGVVNNDRDTKVEAKHVVAGATLGTSTARVAAPIDACSYVADHVSTRDFSVDPEGPGVVCASNLAALSPWPSQQRWPRSRSSSWTRARGEAASRIDAMFM